MYLYVYIYLYIYKVVTKKSHLNSCRVQTNPFWEMEKITPNLYTLDHKLVGKNIPTIRRIHLFFLGEYDHIINVQNKQNPIHCEKQSTLYLN